MLPLTTPMLPVMVPGCAMILSAATAGHSMKVVSRSDSESRPQVTKDDTGFPAHQLAHLNSPKKAYCWTTACKTKRTAAHVWLHLGPHSISMMIYINPQHVLHDVTSEV